MRVLDLFSGIGGFTLGLERAGMRTVAFCEIDKGARLILARHWPLVPCYDDVRAVDARRLRDDGIDVDFVCGGFPCQDISLAGSGRGLEGERSGLWTEYARIVGDVRPRFALVENVGALTARGLASVLGDLAALGYDAQWHVVPAAAIGAPHLRERCWIVAADADRIAARDESVALAECGGAPFTRDDGAPRPAADADGERCERFGLAQHGDEQGASGREPHGLGAGRRREGAPAPDAARERVEGDRADRFQVALAQAVARLLGRDDAGDFWREWPAESPLRGMDDGVPARLDRPRLHGCGNAVVPQIPELFGRAIVSALDAL